MKALTVQQPYAWAIFNGKLVENRTQLWSYRGPLAIHAGHRWSERGAVSDLVRDAWRRNPDNTAVPAERISPWHFAAGAIIGLVDLVDCHPDDGCCKPWGESAYVEHGGRERRRITHLILENPRRLPYPIKCRSALGLWTPPTDVLDALQEVTL